MRKTLLLFTTTALTLLLAAGMAWAALPAPTVVINTDPPPSATPPPVVVITANITATFSEAMSTKSLGICNHCTFTSSSKTFYLLPGNFTAPSLIKNRLSRSLGETGSPIQSLHLLGGTPCPALTRTAASPSPTDCT